MGIPGVCEVKVGSRKSEVRSQKAEVEEQSDEIPLQREQKSVGKRIS
jgi:hypothetical protein